MTVTLAHGKRKIPFDTVAETGVFLALNNDGTDDREGTCVHVKISDSVIADTSNLEKDLIRVHPFPCRIRLVLGNMWKTHPTA